MMKLEAMMLSKVSQTEKDEYHVSSHMENPDVINR
jgi:hypothetical protein